MVILGAYRELLRLSVDIDLTFIDGTLDRKTAIQRIETRLLKIATLIKQRNRIYEINEVRSQENRLNKLIVTGGEARIKIEPNFIMRGTLLPLERGEICQTIEDEFAYSVNNIPLISYDELYAGKICAALSRQHPRDFFDVKILLENEGLTRGICSAFTVYLACSPRPMHEILHPNMLLNEAIYKNEFINMTTEPVAFSELVTAREILIKEINKQLNENERQFLLSLKTGYPDFSLLPYKNLEQLPALQWKILNIQKMDKKKKRIMLAKLTSVLMN